MAVALASKTSSVAPTTVPPSRSSTRSTPFISGLGAGEPMQRSIRRRIESSFNTDLGGLRVHRDASSARVADRLNARAFAFGPNIVLGPRTPPNDLGVMAHEAAHTVQQGASPVLQRFTTGSRDSYEREAHRASAAVVQGEKFSVSERTSSPRVQALGLSDILDGLAELAANVPGYTLLTVIIGRNPINMRVVERNFTNLLRGFMGLIPGGEILFQVLNRYGIVERIGKWVSDETTALGLSWDYIRGRFTAFTDSLSWRDIFHPGDVWDRAKEIFTEPIRRIRSFISRLTNQAITWLKETFMEPLSSFCREIPGYTLVTVLLGRDPFTNAAVPRTALNVVRAFAEFIPGGTEKLNQLVESRALQRAYEWFVQETQTRNLTWARVVGTFAEAWRSLHLEDVLHPIDTLRRIVNIFRPLMRDLIGFAGSVLMKLLELIFEAVMGAGGARILAILKRARDTFLVVIRNPVGFLRNLMSAVGQGVRQFMTNILRHLRDGVIAWLTGPVAAAGVQMPERWDLRGIIWFVMQILGLTWTRIRQKLVRLMGERAVAMLEAGFQLIQEIREKGLVQALRDRITEFFGQLREAALGSIRSFIQQRLVMAGITQLLSMLNPVGAVIQAIIKTYTTIQFFIQRINQILDLVESVVNSIAAIAAGAIGGAANFIERTMAKTIPIILDFLARFIGLGDVGAQVQRTIQGLQQRVDQMLDRAVDWIKSMAQRLVAAGQSAVSRVFQWWKKKVTIRGGEETHTLCFTGDEETAELALQSTPKRIEAFVSEARVNRTSKQEKAALDKIEGQVPVVRDARAELRRLRKSNAPDSALKPQLDKLDGAFAIIGTAVGGLFAGSDVGTNVKPISLSWPKPAWNKYKPIYLYWIESGNAGTWKLSAKEDLKPKFVKKYLPTGAHQVGDTSQRTPPAALDRLGIKNPYCVAKNSEVGPLSEATTPGGAELNDLLGKFGWSASGENMDGDHVKEIQFGGQDVLANLWPLDASINRGAGSTLSRQAVQVGAEQMTIDLMKKVKLAQADKDKGKFAFKISSVR